MRKIFLLKEEPGTYPPLGKYGMMRKRYLEEHRPILRKALSMKEELYPHLREIDEAARRIEKRYTGWMLLFSN